MICVLVSLYALWVVVFEGIEQEQCNMLDVPCGASSAFNPAAKYATYSGTVSHRPSLISVPPSIDKAVQRYSYPQPAENINHLKMGVL
jgi:hypothetical protein